MHWLIVAAVTFFSPAAPPLWERLSAAGSIVCTFRYGTTSSWAGGSHIIVQALPDSAPVSTLRFSAHGQRAAIGDVDVGLVQGTSALTLEINHDAGTVSTVTVLDQELGRGYAAVYTQVGAVVEEKAIRPRLQQRFGSCWAEAT